LHGAAGLDPGFYGIDLDGTLVTAPAEAEGAAPTYKRGVGFYPLLVFLDATGEPLAGILRPGHAGSGTAADHVPVLDAALAQLPVDPATQAIIVRADSAGGSHAFLNHCATQQVRCIVGHPFPEDLAPRVIGARGIRWIPALTADGIAERNVGEEAAFTDRVVAVGAPGDGAAGDPACGGATPLHGRPRLPLPGVSD